MSFTQTIPVHLGDQFRVSNGANAGDGLSFLTELELNDVYELAADANLGRLTFCPRDDGSFTIAEGSELGAADAPLYLDCALTFMTPAGHNIEVVVLVETGPHGHVEQVYCLPLAPLETDPESTLVGADRDCARARFAHVAWVSCSRRTPITLATGALVPREDPQSCSRVPTRGSSAS